MILYGCSLLREFAALLALRRREPGLLRPFRVAGGNGVALGLALGPAALIALAVWDQGRRWVPEEGDRLAPAAALLLGAGLVASGPMVYAVSRRWRGNVTRAS